MKAKADVEETELASAATDIDAAQKRAQADSDNKLNVAELAAIEQDTLRRRFMYPRPDPTTAPPVSANSPQHPTLEQVLADLKYPATKGDLVSRSRDKGAHQDLRYQLERLEDRMYLDFEDVQAALRAG